MANLSRINLLNSKLYLTTIYFIGIILFLLHLGDSLSIHQLNWLTVLFLIISITVLNYFLILLPPKGNGFSMDSAICLATMFVFGIEVALAVLFWSSLIFTIIQRKTVWWKHLFNFSTYTLMIIAAYHTFQFLGGDVGNIQVEGLGSYIIALLVYFSLNITIVGLYFLVLKEENLFIILKGLVKESVSGYFATLVLSLILSILLVSHQNFGLILFTTVVIFLSILFKQYFNLYSEVLKKVNIDELTGLYNHSYFKEVLNDYLENKKVDSLSLAFIDIDDFKKYNDYFGHIAGDELLTFFGKLLKEKCDEEEFFVARYGGEEFVIIFPNVNKDEAYQYLNKLRKEFNDSYFKGVEILPHGCLSFSGGIVEYEKDTYNATEFISKADQAMYRAKTDGKNTIHLFNKNDFDVSLLDLEKEIDQLEQQLRFFLFKDVYTYQHSKRVFQYANLFSQELELSRYDRKLLILGALIHDIGKIEIPRNIINKKGKLSPVEWDTVKKHVQWGKDIVATNNSLQELIPLVELHHERYDGKGYPHNLKGEGIPKLARMLCIVDSFDAMTTERPYQPTKSFSEAINELERCAGTQFDPKYVPTFIKMIRKHYPNKLGA
ncbi:HD-GYP domain-containing protein [Evansella sp. AB-P1]|uniref:diguanylate cyclase n=1 Tax=Evansella sp. AB-P1 TaxID=3037653 RepID=UPI00241E4FEC|nr:HD-GYP domain-containing protein [Evansella sp. AB-P1]MDG5786763.1 HD-GYP domain-containing protein [Evansella sp. AB-P1]